MSNPRDNAPDNGKTVVNTSQTPEIPRSKGSTEVSAMTDGAHTNDNDGNIYPPPSAQMYPPQDFVPVGMTPTSINHFTNPLFTQQQPDANGILSTNHLYAHQEPHNSFQQQQPLPPGLSADDELMTRALYEVKRQLGHDVNQSSHPDQWQNQFDQNHDDGLIASYDSSAFQNLYPTQAATQSLQHAFAQDQAAQQSSTMAKLRTPASPTQQEHGFNPYDPYGQPVLYHYHHAPGELQLQQSPAQREIEEVPSRKRLRSNSRSPPSDDLHSLPVKEKKERRPAQKRPTGDSQRQRKSQSTEREEEPSQKRPRTESQSQRKSQSHEQLGQVSNTVPPQAPQSDNSTPAPVLGESTLDTEPAKQPITVSAKTFHARAKSLLTASTTSYTNPNMTEQNIAYDIASTLMLAGIYLDSKSSVDESAAWLEWTFAMEGIWKRRAISGIPHAVPEGLLRKFGENYADGAVVPIFDGDGRVVLKEGGMDEGKNE